MNKRGLLALVFTCIFALSFVSASSPNVTTSSNTASITSGGNDIYSYEVNYNYTGTVATVTATGHLGEDGVDATYGSMVKDGILSVYGSRLDASAQGNSSDGELFTLSGLDGTAALRYAYFILNDTSGIYVYYNNTAETTVASSSVGFASGGGFAGGSGTAYVLESDTLSKGIEKKLSKGDSFKFGLEGSKSSYVVGVIAVENSSVVLGIKKGVSISLAYGENKRVDLDDDGAEDIVLKAEKADDGVKLFITDNIVAEDAVSAPSEGIKDAGGSSVPVKKEVTYSSPYMEKVTSAVQSTVSGFFSGLWKSFVELFKF